MAERRPTMHDVARAAGVSPATVSRVVNNERYIREETRAAVERAIAELGFQRNEAARALRPGQSTDTIALIIEDVANPFWSAIADGGHRRIAYIGGDPALPTRARRPAGYQQAPKPPRVPGG